jgi:hypothetical protein
MNIARIFLLTLVINSFILPQDKVIVLSKKVGDVLEKEEALKYNLFPLITDFESAVIKQYNAKYSAEVKKNLMGEMIDTSIILTYDEIINMAMLIDYSTEVEKGNFDSKKAEVHLFYTNGEPVQKIEGAGSNYLSRRKYSENLPFIQDTSRIKFQSILRWGAGVGISSYSYNISGVEEFKQKLGITNLTGGEISSTPPILFISFVELKGYSLEFSYGGNSSFKRLSLGMNYLMRNMFSKVITPFAGISVSSLKLSTSYDSGDSIQVDAHYKSKLVGIDIKHSTLGYTIKAGVEAGGDFMSFTVSGANTWVAKKRGTGKADVFIVDLSGFSIEAALKLYFGVY